MNLVGKATEQWNSLFGGNRGDEVGSEFIISVRDIVKEGWLSKQSRNVREWRRRYVVLTKDCIATFKYGPLEVYKSTDATELMYFGHMMTVRSAEQETQKENAFCLQRQKDARFFYFIAETATEKEGWVGAIGRQMVRKTVLIDDVESGDD
eukprot:GEMP01032185.1.p1 GENE.GEMP01032185.1~~GEMP01032185.1.p1  ORF type:complete len:151 (-),score=26.67 GEMP01032185.1:1614-2066(-)